MSPVSPFLPGVATLLACEPEAANRKPSRQNPRLTPSGNRQRVCFARSLP
jgi:hypothetical protein